MRGTPPTHVVRMRTALPVGPKRPLMSRHYASVGLDVGLRACVLPTGKSPPLTPLKKTHRKSLPCCFPAELPVSFCKAIQETRSNFYFASSLSSMMPGVTFGCPCSIRHRPSLSLLSKPPLCSRVFKQINLHHHHHLRTASVLPSGYLGAAQAHA